jgi:hypothetical protein
MRCAGIRRQGRFVPNHSPESAMQQSEFDKLTAALDRAEFAVEDLQKKADELHRKATLAKTMEEIAALNVEAAELLLHLRRLSDAVHAGNPAPPSPAGLRYRARCSRGATAASTTKAFVEVRENPSRGSSHPLHHSHFFRDRRLPTGSNHGRHSRNI